MAPLNQTTSTGSASAALAPALLTVLLLGASGCATEDVDCVTACVPSDPDIINFAESSTESQLFAQGGLTQQLTDGVWHISGTPGPDAAFGLNFPCVNDAKDYVGLRARITSEPSIRGNQLELLTVGNTQDTGDQCARPGLCQDECQPALNASAHFDNSRTTRLWTGFTGGSPETTAFPRELLGMRWRIAESAIAAGDEISITVHELHYVPPDE